MLAAAVQDDLEHIVGYTIIADAGIAILALAALSPDTWEPAREWILIFVTVRSAFAAWAVAIRGAFRTRRMSELSGWAVRAPLLAISLVVIGAAAVGFPELVVWEARSTLVDLTIAGPIGIIVVVSSVAQLAIYLRLLIVGLSRPSAIVAAGLSERPSWPDVVAARPLLGLSGAERAFEWGGNVIASVLDVLWSIPAVIRANRALLAGLLALAVAVLALAVSVGGLGVLEASRAVPGPGGPGPIEGPGAPASESPPASAPVSSPVSAPVSAPQSSPSAAGSEAAPPSAGPSFQPIPS
jgi:formate hydrogenlyase subunit 3/multisubunit Na+/H+ antiporter MnhD subunit